MKNYLTLCLLLSIFSGQLLSQDSTIYFNDFDSPNSGQGWSHYALSGTDQWQVGVPNSIHFKWPHTAPNVWMTNLNNFVIGGSNMVLESPYFDLSDSTQPYALSFYQARSGGTGASYGVVEYSVDLGSSWHLALWPTGKKRNWQGAGGWTSSYLSFNLSAAEIWPLQGRDSVKFRFRYHTMGSTGDGWAIDNFRIATADMNITATRGPDIPPINPNFTKVTVKTDIIFLNQWRDRHNVDFDFHLSADTLLDTNDHYLGRRSLSTFDRTFLNWSNTFSLPTGLGTGIRYIIYECDVADTVKETNENDNINYVILPVDTAWQAPLAFHFDSTNTRWSVGPDTFSTGWERGDPDYWHMENPRSGDEAWHSGSPYTQNKSNHIESPYIDLTNSTNTVFCFWYRYNHSSYNNSLRIELPTVNSADVVYPVFGSFQMPHYKVPRSRLYDWDCHCKDISTHDGEPSTRFRISSNSGSSSSGPNRSTVDDVYIGPAKPDVSIGGERIGRYTPAHIATDTLSYLVFNSGLDNLPSTLSYFYWSSDSLLDAADTYLGHKVEPVLGDTSFVISKFAYTKQSSSPGTWYLIYVADALQTVNEMREYDNVGYFKIIQQDTASLPYYNDFETQAGNWTHMASLGTDMWERTTPQGTVLSQAFSGSKAFMTFAQDSISGIHRMHLFTPIFDLSALQHPVMEFDLLAHFYGAGFNIGSQSLANIMYSTDGGGGWTVLDTTNLSFKRWYLREHLEDIGGYDQFPLNGSGQASGEYLYGKREKTFTNHFDYQGRDYDDTYHFIMDLEFLQGQENVKFMMVYAHNDAQVEGVMLDNFEITEARSDLKLVTNKSLMSSSTDSRLRAFFEVKNIENYMTDSTYVAVVASADTVLDSSDNFLKMIPLHQLRPHEKQMLHLASPVPANWAQMNYLLVAIDPANLISESDENNNIGVLPLDMDTARYFNYPLHFDFEEAEIDGWTWYHDTSGFYHGHRFRHRTVMGEPNYGAQSGQWFLDLQDGRGFGRDPDMFPIHYLESPAFDLRSVKDPIMEFDFMCVGVDYPNNSQGANMEYSTDGGKTWQLITNNLDPNRQNWYNSADLKYLDHEPGWGQLPNWSTAVFDLGFVANEPNVRLRFKVRAKHRITMPGPQGFRMDDFKITGQNIFIQADTLLCSNDTLSFNGTLISSPGYYTSILKNQQNMDSIVGLTVLPVSSYSLVDSIHICRGGNYTFPDSMYFSGILQDTAHTSYFTTAAAGCDSVITTFLRIFEAASPELLTGATLHYPAPATSYQWIDCTTGLSLNGATASNFTPTANGSYAVVVNSGGCMDTSTCYSVNNVGLPLYDRSGFAVFPNPNHGKVTIEYGEEYSHIRLKLLNSLGQLLQVRDYQQAEQAEYQLEVPDGIYYIEISAGERILSRVKVVKGVIR